MNEFAERIERDFPVRRKEKEKVDFRTWLVYTLKELGYSPKLESGTSALSAGGNVTNVVVGDIEKAKIVLAAHYDTGVREVLPPLICPTRPATYMLYEALMPLLALAVSFLISFGVTFTLNMPNMTLPLFLLLLVVTLFYPKYGKSETNNKNANTSGVVALLEVAKALTPRYRGEVCFLFLDGGTQGGKGAKRLIHAHPELKKKSVVVLDCVGEGDELLILPGKASRWNDKLLDAILEQFSNSEKKTCFLKTDGLVHYPSDNRAFMGGTVICAQAVVEKVHVRGRSIRGQDDLAAGLVERVERMEKFVLHLLLARDELHVVHEQQVRVAVLRAELTAAARAHELDEFVDEIIALDVDDLRRRARRADLMSDGVNEVRFAKAGVAVDK